MLATDPLPEMLRLLSDRLPDVRTTVASDEDLPLPDRSVDVVGAALSVIGMGGLVVGVLGVWALGSDAGGSVRAPAAPHDASVRGAPDRAVGDVHVLAPETNQSAVGHTKTLMRPLRVRERTLADGSTGYSVDGSPTDCVSHTRDDQPRRFREPQAHPRPVRAADDRARRESRSSWRRARSLRPSSTHNTRLPTTPARAMFRRRSAMDLALPS